MKMLKGLIMSIQFFTSIPIPYEVPMDRRHINMSIKMFPVLGLLQGFLYGVLAYALIQWTPLSALATAFIIWLALIVVTGGIHLDGWMDCSDAFFSYRDREKRLEIMKDPRMGAFGVLSVIVILSARFLFIYEIVVMAVDVSYIFITLIPFVGKIVMGVVLINVKSAKADGLGTLFKQAASKGTLWIYPIYLLLILVLILFQWPQAVLGVLLLIIVAVLFVLVAFRKTIHWFGGITGDVLGASVEGVEILLWMTVWLWHYFAMG